MIPLYLYLKNFLCHSESEINFNFNSALILGKVNDSFDVSNGSGKSTIFNAIEFVLFNDFPELKMEKLIRDNTDSLQVIFDFEIDGQIYRIDRKRSRSGTSATEVKQYTGLCYESKTLEWKNLSGRRNTDSEAQIKKIIKINQKSFRNSVHFIQNDFSGLTTASSSEKRNILKQVFDLSIYQKLEKLAKIKESIVNKDLIKSSIIIEEKQLLKDKSILLNNEIEVNTNLLINIKKELSSIDLSLLTNRLSELKNNKTKLLDNYPILKSSLLEINSKYNNTKDIKDKLEVLVLSKSKELTKLINDNNIITILVKEDLSASRDLIDAEIKIVEKKLQDNNVNLRSGNNEVSRLSNAINVVSCDSCLQPMSKDHLDKLQDSLAKVKEEQLTYSAQVKQNTIKLNELKVKLTTINNTINTNNSNIYIKEKNELSISKLNNEIQYNQSKIDDYNKSLLQLEDTKSKLELELTKYNESSFAEIDNSILEITNLLNTNTSKFNLLSKDSRSLETSIQVSNKYIEDINNKLLLIDIEEKKINELKREQLVFDQLVKAFSSKGIPALLINNLLSDIELKANEYLKSIKPGLEVFFSLSKENSNGEEVDDFSIKYIYNNQERDYHQISGAMKFSATFAIKLALSLIIQDILNVNIKFLLFDEIDQCLDDYSSLEFVNLVKRLERDYKILVITHNRRLKDKFNNLIVIEQDENMVSKACQLEC